MWIKTIGVVTGSDSYEKDGVVHESVSVGCGKEAYNIRGASGVDFILGDVVTVIGDREQMKSGAYLKNARIAIASAADRLELSASGVAAPVHYEEE